MRKLLSRFGRILYEHFIEPLVRFKYPPRLDARGVAAGLVVGFGVPLGGHIVTLTLLRLLFRFNFPAAIAFTWVCDPFNVIFVYYGYYCLGSLLLGRPLEMNFEVFRTLVSPIADRAYFWEHVSAFMSLGQDLLTRWFVGAETLAVVSGVLGYVITYKIQLVRCRRAAKKMELKYEDLIGHLETKATREAPTAIGSKSVAENDACRRSAL